MHYLTKKVDAERYLAEIQAMEQYDIDRQNGGARKSDIQIQQKHHHHQGQSSPRTPQTEDNREFGPVVDEHGNPLDPESTKYRDKVLDEMLVT